MTNGQDNVIQGEFSALGHAGSGAYTGLEILPLTDEMYRVKFNSDEFTAVCPVTGQPDMYELEIDLSDTNYSIESKSLKLYLTTFRNVGAFAEALALRVKKDVVDAIESYNNEHGGVIFHEDSVSVTITQKRRGGIRIEATA